jgi:uncharacterized membrane protein
MKAVSGLFNDFATGQRVVDDLVQAGFSRDSISMVANDANGEYAKTLKTENHDVKGGEGASFGAVTGALIGLGAMLIPGIGPIIGGGALVAGLVGAGVGAAAGAVTGGITASLVKLGVDEDHAHYYAEGVRRGGVLVVAHIAENQILQAQAIIQRHQPIDVTTRAEAWRESGWDRFDDSRPPLTPDEIRTERDRYLSEEVIR